MLACREPLSSAPESLLYKIPSFFGTPHPISY
uniref:Uncharacterized protein n=1 Tax=Anguilla anguilla TaxID=7936 RepID=A0A0E9VQP7_ANGAN